ncbi:30S ribosomal protein S19 [Microgenomates group bacterium RIFCSPLOWO2_01_FULL_47_10]|nr:ribosomal protein S19 [uncultured bacterium]OGV92396.1 MAG: 30S ribosomal protein S19 [Microgenomates group bacterium RIFCSPLOWO2_01_FULL_47_10]
MSRSTKKGPYVDERLLGKIAKQKDAGKKEAIKTWARNSQISPDFVGVTFMVHNGKIFHEVYVTEAMVGHRLGEFSPTRTFKGHGRMVKRLMTKT